MSNALFGIDGLSPTTLIIIAVVLAVIVGLLIWGIRRRGHMAFIRGGSNRQPRLAVLDAAAVDARRRLVLVRRDNVEHLIMIGGPSDIVVERGINRVSAAPRPVQEAAAAQAPQQPVAAKAQHQTAPPKTPPRSEPTKQQSEPIATEPLDIPAAKPARKPEEPKKADAPADSKPAPPVPPAPPQEAKSAPPPPQAGPKPSSPPPAETAPAAPAANAAPTPTRPEKQSSSAPELAAVAVSAAAASAADQMAKLSEGHEDEKSGQPAAKTNGAQAVHADEPAVEIEPPIVPPVSVSDQDNAVKAELEDVLGAAQELILPEENTESNSADEIAVTTQVDPVPPSADIPPFETEEAGKATDIDQPHAMSAEELIADFDELLEAEITKAQQMKSVNEPENASPQPPLPGDKPPPGAPAASLEDEMKKLLGDLNVKQ